MTADVIAWLNSPEGEEWSRRRHHGYESWLPPAPTEFAAPVLAEAHDPCGSGPAGGAR